MLRAFDWFWAGLCVGIVILAMVMDWQRASWQSQTIAHGCAYYAPDTGKFTWGQP